MIRIKGESNTATVRLVIFITVYLLFFLMSIMSIDDNEHQRLFAHNIGPR